MSYNGTGVFQINSAGQPVVTNTTITSTAFNLLTADLATGLSTAICKDGQSTITANIPMSGFRLVGLGAASIAGDAIPLANAITWTPTLNFGGATTGITYTTQTGKYILMGNVVVFWCTILLSSKGSATGNATITGLPTSPSVTSCGAVFGDAITFAGGLQSKMISGSSTIFLYALATGVSGPLADTNFSNTSEINITGAYF